MRLPASHPLHAQLLRKLRAETGARPAVKRPKARSTLEETLALQIRAEKLTEPVREFRFAPERQYRADFGWELERLLVECEGGIWTNGAHTRGAHFESDAEKYNLASELGYTVLRYTERSIKNGSAVAQIARFLKVRGAYRLARGD